MVPLKLERKAGGIIPFMLPEQVSKDLVVPLLYDTVVLNAVADVVVAVEKTLETPDVTRELVQGEALIQLASVLVGQFVTESVGGIAGSTGAGPLHPGGPWTPGGGGAAEAQSARRVSKTKAVSRVGILKKVRDVCGSLLRYELDTPTSYYTRARFARPHIRSDFLDRMSLPLLSYVTAHLRASSAPRRFRVGSFPTSSLDWRSSSTQRR